MNTEAEKHKAPSGSQYLKWLILILTVFSYLMGFIVRFAWPPLITVAVPDLKIDMTQAGLFMSAFYIGYVLTHIPAGLLADRFGVRYLLAGALMVEGVSTLGMGYVASFIPGFLLRIVTGLGAGMVYSACVKSVTTWFSDKERGMAFGFLMVSPTLGVLVANIVVPMVLRFFQWRTVFTIVGVWAIALSVVLFLMMKDTGERAQGKSFMEGLRFVVRNKNILKMSGAGFCLMWIQISFISWGNAALKNAGFSLENAGAAMTLLGIGGLFGPLVSGYLSDRSGNKKWLVITGFFCLIPLILLFGFAGTSFGAKAVMACALGFVFGYLNTFLPLMVAEYSGPQWAASAGGVSGCIFQIGAIIGPVFLGLSIDITGKYQVIWWLLAAGPLAGLLFLLSLKAPKTVPNMA